MSNYKDTVLLPKTDFPMKAGLPQREPQILKKWESEKLYQKIQESRKDCPVYILHDGPPFANGDVHMGTALNKILKDVVVKSKTMAGFRVPFIPGWDCHGLPIEFKVVQSTSGLSPAEIRRRCADYARKFIDIQRQQFRRLGVFGDWENPYLTMEPGYEAKILECLAVFVKKGLVYRKKKPVLWSWGACTALAEAEVEYKEKVSPSIYVRFPIVQPPSSLFENAALAIWTTTPWTLPANLAIAVHPDFHYVLVELPGHGRIVLAEPLLGSLVQKLGVPRPHPIARCMGSELANRCQAKHPFLERFVPVLPANFVTADTGTGLVHIAPGHGEEDYHLGLQYNLDLLSPVDDNGRFTSECGLPELVGKHVFEANPSIIQILRERSALIFTEEYTHSYPHCWRSKTPVIFRAVEQFFIRIDELRPQAIQAIDSAQWIPHWGINRIRGTVETRPDWCISRQRTWGVPLPAFHTPDGKLLLEEKMIREVANIIRQNGTDAWFEWSDEKWNELLQLPKGTTRSLDTLDVWIDSGVSHQAVLCNHPELSFPADLYLEATDQHRGWFQSSLMTSIALGLPAPYRKVLTHGFVVDVDTRKKISKSEQGGYQKPTNASHYVEKYGADLVRLWVCSVNFTDDVPFSEEIFTRLSDSYRRIRNTLRILLGNLHAFNYNTMAIPFSERTEVDRWILAETANLCKNCRVAYENLEFYKVYQEITQFCAVELSSLYIDITKDRLYCDPFQSARRRSACSTMHEVFDALCRLLAPILAFTAEEAWSYFRPNSSIHLEFFPDFDQNSEMVADSALSRVRGWLEIRSRVSQSIESAIKTNLIGKPLEACVHLHVPKTEFESILPYAEQLEEFLILSHLELKPAGEWKVELTKTPWLRCERCWRHRPDVGKNPKHPTLCSRCADAVEGT